MLVNTLRNGLGLIIVGIDKITRPSPIQRNAEEQVRAQSTVKGVSLYQHYACPFCIKTRRAIHQLNVKVKLCDIRKDQTYRQELQELGGRVMVPCLRIEESTGVRWLYESKAIIAYLQQTVKAV